MPGAKGGGLHPSDRASARGSCYIASRIWRGGRVAGPEPAAGAALPSGAKTLASSRSIAWSDATEISASAASP